MNETIAIEKDQELFIKKLREETAESHQQLEDNPLSKALLDPQVTLADYQAYLAKLFGITVACERQIFPLIENLLPDLEKRTKSALLTRDLLHTGLTEAQVAALPLPYFDVQSEADALGIAYVIEGSTLGGRIIYKHIHSKLGFTETAGASYFGGYGSETGPMWKSFIAVLARYATESGESAAIIDSARKTFFMIDRWL